MRLTRKKVSGASVILSVVFFYLAAILYVIALQLFQLGLNNVTYTLYVLSMTAGTVAAAGCLVCAYLAIWLPKTKILKETYFFVAFVPVFSILTYVLFNCVLWIDFPAEPLIVFSIILGTPLSCVFAGYSESKIWMRLKRLGLTQGITVLTLILLGLIPIIEFLPNVAIYRIKTSGYIAGEATVFESGNDAAKVQEQIAETVFSAEVPIPSDNVFVAEQAVNVTNQASKSLYLKVYIEDLSGNLSKVKQLKIFFTLGNGSEICPFNVNDGNVKYEEVSLSMESHATIAIGVISSAQNASSTGIIIMSWLMRLKDNNLGMDISINSL